MSTPRLVRLSEICRFSGGGTPSKKNPNYYDGDIPWVTPKDMKSWNINGSIDRISQEAVENSSAKLHPAGSVLVVIRSGVLKHTLPVGVARRPVTVNQDIKALKCDLDKAYPDYVARALKHGEPRLLGTVRGTTADNISSEVLKGHQIPLPPLEEQRRIADILDRADALRRKREESLKLVDDLLQSIFLDMFGDPVTNPMGWPVKPLGEFGRFVGGGTPKRAEPGYFNGTIPWISPKDMRGEAISGSSEHISEDAVSESATTLVQPGALLFVVKSKVLAKRLPVAVAECDLCFSQDLKALVGAPHLSRYLLRHLTLGSAALLRFARGANTEGLTLRELREYRVMNPPPDLVQRYVRADHVLQDVRREQVDGCRVTQALAAALTQRAFRGEL